MAPPTAGTGATEVHFLMAVDDWVMDAVDRTGPSGASLRDVQRWIDERHHEELSVDVIAAALGRLERQRRLRRLDDDRWITVRRRGAEAFDALFANDRAGVSADEDGPREEEST